MMQKEPLRRYGDDFAAEDRIPWHRHLQLLAMLLMIVIFIVWASFAEIDEVSRGEGRVIPASEVQVVQSLEGGIIEEMLVAEGDLVAQDQPLLRIKNTQAKSDYSAATQRYLGLLAATARLEAEAQGKDPAFQDEIVKGAPDSVRAEQAAFDANRRQYEDQKSVLEQQKRQKEQEADGIERRIADTAKVVELAKAERNMVAPLVEKGSSSKMELLKLEQQIASQQAELNSLTLSLPRTRSAVAEAQERLVQLQSGFQAEAQKQLAEKTADLNALKEAMAGYQDRSDRTVIKSPAAGTIKDIKITTVRGVAKPGETILEIVPNEDQLLIESRIKPSDIAFLYPGQKAVVRPTAFDFGIFGALEGHVVDISADSIRNECGESFYRVKVKTDKAALKKGGKEYALIPGMQATVDIVTGTRTVMTYLLKPFVKTTQAAFRER